MYQTDLEDLIDEHNLAHGLPLTPRNPPRPPVASSDLTAGAKPKRPRRPRRPRMVQTDIWELLEADQNAEAPTTPADALSVSTEEVPSSSQAKAPRGTEQPAHAEDAAKAEGIKFFKEAAHIRKEEPSQPAYDYRFLLKPIQGMLTPNGGRGPAICACGHARGKTVNVHLVDRSNGTQRATTTGIYRCGNGEACPICARHVAALRAKRYRMVHEAVNALGGTMLTFVFTIEHDRNDALAPLLAALKAASTGSRSDRFWNQKIAPLIHAVGAMIDVHVRWSRRGGWHPHLHVTLPCLARDTGALQTGAAMLIERFVERLAKLGYRASTERQSATILDARPSAYPAHHHRRAQIEGNLADDMDDDTSLSPFDIAELAVAGDVGMEGLFVEFFEAMRGTKSGVITATMARKLGIEASTDPGPRIDETTRVGSVPSPVWMKLLGLNLIGTFLNHVESFGREGWQRARWWAMQQTGLAPPVDVAMADEMTVAIKSIALLSDPEAKAIGRNFLASQLEGWTALHGHDLVAATLSYAEAHVAFTTHGNAEAEDMAAVLETWADKAARRRRDQVSHTTLPMGDGPPSPATVSHEFTPDRVRQSAPISQQI